MRRFFMLTAIIVASLLMSGCPTFDVGGWIESVDSEGKNTKATFGGSFSCTIGQIPWQTEPELGTVVEGYFQYHDHNETISWKHKERNLSFHGDFIQNVAYIGDDPALCEIMDGDYIANYGLPDGYCGPASLQPAPKKVNDDGYGQDLAYRIAVVDGDDDEIFVWLGPKGDNECPKHQDGSDADDLSDCDGQDLCYENSGILRGGEITVYLPLVD